MFTIRVYQKYLGESLEVKILVVLRGMGTLQNKNGEGEVGQWVCRGGWGGITRRRKRRKKVRMEENLSRESI